MRWRRHLLGFATVVLVAVPIVASAGVDRLDRAATVDSVAQRLGSPLRGFTVAATGDILTERLVIDNGAAAAGDGVRYDFAPMFAQIAPIIQRAHLAICHMEVPLGWPDQQPGAYGRSLTANRLLGPFEMAAGVAATGFDRCSTASNHSFDLWEGGIDSTLAALDAFDVGHVGTARSPDESIIEPFTLNGVRVAHLSISTASNTELPEPWRFNHSKNPQRVIDQVQDARDAGAEVVIVSYHVGRERESAPIPVDRAFVEAFTAPGGVDLVIGHGPHVVQPVETVNGATVFWSVGNLVSGMGEFSDQRYSAAALDGLIAAANITVTADGAVTVEPAALTICNERGTRDVWPAARRFDTRLPASLRQQLTECFQRTAAVVAVTE